MRAKRDLPIGWAGDRRGGPRLGWADGRNVRIELRWDRGDINRIRALAQELVGLQPEIIVTNGTPETAALQ
jgi:putative ABC transport system substrate-binding protein